MKTRIVTASIITVIIGVPILLFMMIVGPGLGMRRLNLPIVWMDFHDPSLTSDGGSTVTRYMFTTSDKTEFRHPLFIFRNNSLIYWSPDDGLRIVPPVGKPRWVSLRYMISKDLPIDVDEILPNAQGIILHVSYGKLVNGSPPSYYYLLNLSTMKRTLLPDAVEMRSYDTSSDYALMSANRQIVVVSGGRRTVVVALTKDTLDWAYSPRRHKIYLLSEKYITTVDTVTHATSKFRMALTVMDCRNIYSVENKPWVLVSGFVQIESYYVIAYADDGACQGLLIKRIGGSRGLNPILPNAQQKALLQQFSINEANQPL